jgi:hypothetical protein
LRPLLENLGATGKNAERQQDENTRETPPPKLSCVQHKDFHKYCFRKAGRWQDCREGGKANFPGWCSLDGIGSEKGMFVFRENLLSSPFMNILIEDAETLEYLASNGQWTKIVSEARSFEATQAALQVAKKELIRKFNIVWHISQTKQFINMDHGRGKGPEAAPA